MSLPSEEERFGFNVEGLCETVVVLIKKFNDCGVNTVSPMLITLASKFVSTFTKKKVINGFIEKSYEFWNQIKTRNNDFFLENATKVFGDIPIDNVDVFKGLCTAKDRNGNFIMTSKDYDELWPFFESFVKISIKYIHKERKPYTSRTSREVIYGYENPKFAEYINLPKAAEEWLIKLEWKER